MFKIVLMYHDVYSISPTESGFQSEVSKTYKVDSNNFQQHLEIVKGKDVLFTFDDGGVSFYNVIAPMLERYNRRGLFFVSTQFIDQPGFLSSEQIRDLFNRGHIIGSHTHTHPKNMSCLNSDDIKNEWSTSKKILENILGAPIEFASVPNGRVSAKVYNELSNAKFKGVYTSEPTTNDRLFNTMFISGRYVITSSTSHKTLNYIITNSIFRKMLFCKWSVLRVVKKVLGGQYYKLRQLLAK